MKKFIERLTAFLICVCLIASALPAQAAGAPDWAADAYKTLEARSILTDPKTSGAITRGEFVELLVRLLEETAAAGELAAYPAKADGYFADSHSDYLLKAAAYGILEGSLDGDQRYANAGDHLTREQAAKMVCSLLDFFSQKLGHPVESVGEPAIYGDAASISVWAQPFTGRVASYGLMKGDDLGNFNPQGNLDWPAAVVLGSRILSLLDGAAQKGPSAQETPSTLELQNQVSWSGASGFGYGDISRSKPKTGYAMGYYTISNADGTVSGLVVGSDAVTVERFNADGSLAETKTLEKELSIFGAFFDSGEHFYLAFGQMYDKDDSSKEVWRIVQYDRQWNRLGTVSVNGKDSYTTQPFRSTVARMAVSGDSKTVTLYAARTRYDGHQSNITILMNTSPFSVQKVMGEQFPSNHVSHSFGQFVRYDGNTMVTVDHGDAYPRSFVFQDGTREIDLLEISGETGENVTHAIGSGFEVTQDGYLFLGCSTPQRDYDAEQSAPWNVFLTCLGKSGKNVELTWLTHSETTINRARLVKLGEDSFVAMWQQGEDVHYQKLNGKGGLVGTEQVLAGALIPPTEPVVINGDICWIQTSNLSEYRGKAILYRIGID